MTNDENKQLVLDWLKKSSPTIIKNSGIKITLENISRQLLECYQGTCSQLFNDHLRDKNSRNSNIEKCVNLISTELKTFPQFSNQIIYRNESISGEFGIFYSWFVENQNEIISFPSFLSCSKKYKWMESFELKFQIQTIDDSNAYDICTLKLEHSEEEVLFLPQTKFKISEIIQSKKLIKLVETRESATIILYHNEGFYACDNIGENNTKPSLTDEGDDF